jgi:hypothetical protein
MSTITEHTKTIDGITYKTRTLPASKGLVILPKLLALFGEPVLKLMFTADEDQRTELLKEPKILASILHQIAKQAAEDAGLLVIRDLMEGVNADKVKVGDAEIPGEVHTHFDGHFAGRYTHLAAVSMWVASCNFTGP